MGLDNGIYLKNKRPEKVPFWVRPESVWKDKLHLCYWRKCWNLRREILSLIEADRDEYLFELNREHIQKIRKLLQYYCWHPKKWKDSYWEWEVMRWRILRDVMNLVWLEGYMKKHQVEVFFYDSY